MIKIKISTDSDRRSPDNSKQEKYTKTKLRDIVTKLLRNEDKEKIKMNQRREKDTSNT